MAAYSLAKLDLPGANGLTVYLLVGSSLPIQLFLVPLFFLWRNLGLVNNLFGLTIIYIAVNSPFAIFLLRSYMLQLPKDFEDAARIDGANEWQVFQQIVIPLSWPGFLTVGLVVALSVWNEFLLATVFLTDQDKFTVVTSYYNFTSRFSRDWGLTSAAAVMMIVPIIVIFLALQRRFVEGLTQGGLKA
jgi:raffinose/stachyose/melibiose transport system permease protein